MGISKLPAPMTNSVPQKLTSIVKTRKRVGRRLSASITSTWFRKVENRLEIHRWSGLFKNHRLSMEPGVFGNSIDRL